MSSDSCTTDKVVTLDFVNSIAIPGSATTQGTPCDCINGTISTIVSTTIIPSTTANDIQQVTFQFSAEETSARYIGKVIVTLPGVVSGLDFFDAVGFDGANIVSKPDRAELISIVDISFSSEEDISSSLAFNIEDINESTVNTPSVDVFLTTSTSSFPSFCPPSNIVTEPLPSVPPPGNNFCTNPIIQITALRSIVTGDFVELVYRVQDDCFYENCNSCWLCCTSPIDHGTQFDIFLPFVNCTIQGCGSVQQKLVGNNTGVLTNAALKLILGRLVFGSFDIRWLFQCNNLTLRAAVASSRYNGFISILDELADSNQFFVCCEKNCC